MDSGQIFVLLIIGMSTFGWVAKSWIKARHGYPLEDDKGNPILRADPQADRKIALLAGENADLRGRLLRLEERIAVLERIATDGSARLAREIDALR